MIKFYDPIQWGTEGDYIDKSFLSVYADIRTPSTYGERALATFKESVERLPTTSLYRMLQLDEAQGNVRWYDPELDALDEEGNYVSPEDYYKKEYEALDKRNPVINAGQWQKHEFYDKDIQWHPGMRTDEAKFLKEQKTKERERQDILSRTKSTLAEKVSFFAIGLVAEALDPINYLAAYAPVARAVPMLSKIANVTSRRLVTGAIEGAVGNLLIEPIVYTSAKELQADYGLSESLMNVGIGGLFGAGLHGFAGKISDMLEISVQNRMKAAEVAEAQSLAGRDVHVEDLIQLEVDANRGVYQEPKLDEAPVYGSEEVAIKDIDFTEAPETKLTVDQINNDIAEFEIQHKSSPLNENFVKKHSELKQEIVDVTDRAKKQDEIIQAVESCIRRGI